MAYNIKQSRTVATQGDTTLYHTGLRYFTVKGKGDVVPCTLQQAEEFIAKANEPVI